MLVLELMVTQVAVVVALELWEVMQLLILLLPKYLLEQEV